jgi:hypothetical protein
MEIAGRLIDDAIDLTKGYYKWTPPDSFVTAIFENEFCIATFYF